MGTSYEAQIDSEEGKNMQLFSYQLENDGIDTSMLDWDIDNVVFTNDEVEILDTLKMLEAIE